MAIDDQLFALWRIPPDTLDDPAGAFAALYADPVIINDVPMPVTALVDRARALHRAFTEHEIDLMLKINPAKILGIPLPQTAGTR